MIEILMNTGDAMSTALAGGFFGMYGIFMLVWCLFAILGLVGLILWIWMLIDCLKREFKGENDKLLWILVILFGGIIGGAIYYFMIKRKEDKLKNP